MGRSRVRVKINRGAVSQLAHEIEADHHVLEDAAKATAAACNEESSWGGYYSEVDTSGDWPRARVWSVKRGDGEPEADRGNRLVRNLDAGG